MIVEFDEAWDSKGLKGLDEQLLRAATRCVNRLCGLEGLCMEDGSWDKARALLVLSQMPFLPV